MRRLIVGGAAAALIAGSGGLALAATGPGPNGNNNHGLCTAYFQGSENGQAHKHSAPPFAALEKAAQNESGSTPAEQVANYCAQYLGGNGNGNGNNGNPNAGRQPTS